MEETRHWQLPWTRASTEPDVTRVCVRAAASALSVRVVAAVAADLDLQRREVVQTALLHSVAETLLFLLDHGAPHLLQRGILLLCLLHHLPPLVTRPPAASPAALEGEEAGRALAVLTAGADVIVCGAQSAPQAACGQEEADAITDIQLDRSTQLRSPFVRQQKNCPHEPNVQLPENGRVKSPTVTDKTVYLGVPNQLNPIRKMIRSKDSFSLHYRGFTDSFTDSGN